MRIGVISEVMNDGFICMMPSSFANIRNAVLANVDGRMSPIFLDEKEKQEFLVFDALGSFHRFQAPSTSLDDDDDEPDDGNGDVSVQTDEPGEFVNLVKLCGPMSRNGGACSYGTKTIRDQIMQAAQDHFCRAHIIYCDTPGGFADCIQDIRLAVNYAHDHGQRVDMFIDGVCASGGAFVSALCDHVWFVNPEDKIGSIGMYWASFLLPDGAKNTITSELYREYYAQASTHKNESVRLAAEGNMEVVKKMTEEHLAQLIENLKKDRPSILDEQMSGEMYKMSDSIGTLVDGQSSLSDVAKSLITDWHARNGAALPRKEAAVLSSTPSSPQASATPQPPQTLQTTQTPKQMKTYTHIPAAIGEDPMESLDDELTLQPAQAEALENVLAQGNQQVEELRQQMEQMRNEHAAEIERLNTEHQASINGLDSVHQAAIDQLNAVHQAAIDQLNAEHQAAIDQLNTEHQAALSEQTNLVSSLTDQVASLNQQVTDLQATIDEVNDAQGHEPQTGTSPANNGMSAPPAPHIVTSSSYDPRLSAAENAARHRQAVENLNRQAFSK